MAGIRWFGQTHQSVNRRSILGSIQGTVNDGNKKTNNKTATPQFLKFAVSGVTELLRLFSSFDKGRLDRVSYKQKDEILVSGIDDIVTILRSDYENAYFVTGTELYSRNLRLLVPFFEYPSIGLQNIKKVRTYLKLPWKPLISIDGSTVYELNDELKITRHAESWNVSALEAVGQIFTPGDRN
ncbi:hypothetical protein KPL70_015072 [Citrus sinensis]|nr:hypothetical protein KPL70_015072 [Citrus sinensis]